MKENKSIIFYSIIFYSIIFYYILLYSILFYSILFFSILFYPVLFYSILFYSILFYISGGERGQGDSWPLHLFSHNQPGLSPGFRDLELTSQSHVFSFSAFQPQSRQSAKLFLQSSESGPPPTPNPQVSVTPPPPPGSGGGAHSLAREGVGESQLRLGDIHCGTLWYFSVSTKGFLNLDVLF